MPRRRRGYVSSSHPSDTFPLQWPALEGPEATAPQHVQLGLSLEPLGAPPAGTSRRKDPFNALPTAGMHAWFAVLVSRPTSDTPLAVTWQMHRLANLLGVHSKFSETPAIPASCWQILRPRICSAPPVFVVAVSGPPAASLHALRPLPQDVVGHENWHA